MKLFYLNRKEDVSGISGTGRVAEGVCFSDGSVALHWTASAEKSTTLYKSIKSMMKIHGHENRTEVVWIIGEIKG